MCVTFGGIKQGGVELLLPPQQIRGRHGSNLLTQSWVLNRWLAAPAPVDAVGGGAGRETARGEAFVEAGRRSGGWGDAMSVKGRAIGQRRGTIWQRRMMQPQPPASGGGAGMGLGIWRRDCVSVTRVQ